MPDKKKKKFPHKSSKTSLHYQAPNNSQADFSDILLPKFL